LAKMHDAIEQTPKELQPLLEDCIRAPLACEV
jgi:hypothetical protein